ncbi:MAG: hypothetical protein RL375_1142 [Pseudomonadota bacterium]
MGGQCRAWRGSTASQPLKAPTPGAALWQGRILGMDLRLDALAALCLRSPADKLAATAQLWTRAVDEPVAGLDTLAVIEARPDLPGRPDLPRLVDPRQVPQRSVHTREGRAALIHAIAHIEFNAINLALDAVWRYPGMPRAYYLDWLRVAAEEAGHHAMLVRHLASLGHVYGDFDAHDGLWGMCVKTADDVLARMALVPRTLEARGLDATPLIQSKLQQVGDLEAVAILDVLLRDEVGHVAVGNHWYHWLCRERGLEPLAHYRFLSRQHQAPRPRGPFNFEARARAGFSAAELDDLQT